MTMADGKDHFAAERILSSKAIRIINRELEAGAYADRKDEREPPFMAPSADPNDYSKVCSRVYRFGSTTDPLLRPP